jgi:hypothetical protein
MNRNQPIIKAGATKLSASGPGDRIAHSGDIAIYFREDCRTLADSLQLEMVVAQYDLRLRDIATPQGIPIGDAASASVIAELERHGDELSHAILRALADLGTGERGTRSAEAAERLAERSIELPDTFADVGATRALGAWRDTRDAYPGEYVLFVDFEHPQGRRHGVAVFVEPRGTVKHIGLMPPATDHDPDDPFHPSALESLPIATAGEILGDAIQRTWGESLELTDDYRAIIAAARARSIHATAPAGPRS